MFGINWFTFCNSTGNNANRGLAIGHSLQYFVSGNKSAFHILAIDFRDLGLFLGQNRLLSRALIPPILNFRVGWL